MSGLRKAGLAGAALALTGGVVYLLWTLRDIRRRRQAEKLTLHQNFNGENQENLVEKETSREAAREARARSQVRFNA